MGTFQLFDMFRRIFPQMGDFIFYRVTFIPLELLTAAILGIVLWLIYRLGITLYVDLVKERRRQLSPQNDVPFRPKDGTMGAAKAF